MFGDALHPLPFPPLKGRSGSPSSERDWATGRPRATLQTVPTEPAKKPAQYAPHPDDEDDVRAASDAADRKELLSEEETAAMMRELLSPAK